MTQRQLDRFIVGIAWAFVWFMVGYAVAHYQQRGEEQLAPVVVEPGDCEWDSLEFACAAGEPCKHKHWRREIDGAVSKGNAR